MARKRVRTHKPKHPTKIAVENPPPPILPPVPPPPPIPPEDIGPWDEDRPLTDDEHAFLRFYATYRNAAKAYREAFPHVSARTAQKNGETWICRPHIAAEYAAIRHAEMRRASATTDNVLREIQRIAFSDPIYCVDRDGVPAPLQHIPYEARKAIQSIELLRETCTTRGYGKHKNRVTVTTKASVIRYKLWDKPNALRQLAEHLGITQEITPLDALLNLLPNDLATQVRGALMRQEASRLPPAPSSNGHHPPVPAGFVETDPPTEPGSGT